MAYQSWPAALPQYVMEQGYSEANPDTLLITNMEAGRPKTRRRFTANTRQFTCSMAMSAAEKAIFDDFYDNLLLGGSLPFTWVHPLTRAAGNFQFRKPVPKWTVRGSAHIVAFAMEQLP